MTLAEPLRLTVDEHAAVWGGSRLTGRPGIGELWVAHPDSVVCGGRHEGATLAELCETYRDDLLGDLGGPGFPLIVKLLDTADWLSVQVHPDDYRASQFEGPGARGKTEAWHIIKTTADAEIVIGPANGITDEELRASLCGDRPLEMLERRRIADGDSVLIPAGTIHTMSAGVLAYEVQQASNTTYRAYDWGRDRDLHIGRFWEAADTSARALVESSAADNAICCEHFRMVVRTGKTVESPAGGFQLVTAIDGDALASGDGWSARIASMDTILVPACLGAYALETRGRAVLASPSTQRAG